MPPLQYLSLMDAMARMNLRADAARYYFGYIWWILEPLLYVAVFYVVFNVILDSRRLDFLAFLMCGKLAFIWFSKSVNQASNSILANRGLVGKINMPKTLFPMAVIHEGLYKQVTVFLLLFAVLLVYGYRPSSTWLALAPIIGVNYLMIVACSLIGACLVCLMRDFSMVIGLGMLFLMFTSGIFWDVRDLGDPEKTALLLAVNPLAFILDAYRQVLMYNQPPDWLHLGMVGAGAAGLCLVMLRVMQRGNQFLARRVLTS